GVVLPTRRPAARLRLAHLAVGAPAAVRLLQVQPLGVEVTARARGDHLEGEPVLGAVETLPDLALRGLRPGLPALALQQVDEFAGLAATQTARHDRLAGPVDVSRDRAGVPVLDQRGDEAHLLLGARALPALGLERGRGRVDGVQVDVHDA